MEEREAGVIKGPSKGRRAYVQNLDLPSCPPAPSIQTRRLKPRVFCGGPQSKAVAGLEDIRGH